jgi:dihydroxyacetone kinase-like protein
MDAINIEDIKSIIRNIKSIMDDKRDYLIELDGVMGDGDLGITMTKAFTAAAEEVERSDEKIPGKLLMKAGMAMAKAAPSTMGTLMATGFMRGGKALAEDEAIGITELAIFFDAFTNVIMERGKSKPGNKTILDVLFPITISLQDAVKNNMNLKDGIVLAFHAAQKGLEDSKQMKAQHGRAAYYQDASIGKQDGGATVGLFLIEGFYKYIQ